MTYRIELTRAAERDLSSIPAIMLQRLDTCILGLADDPLPPGVKKLKNSDGLYRVRVSDNRIIYRIEQEILTILVVKIGHRREVYRVRENSTRPSSAKGYSNAMKKTEPIKTHKQMVYEWKNDPEFNAAYNTLDTEFNLLRALLLARKNKGEH